MACELNKSGSTRGRPKRSWFLGCDLDETHTSQPATLSTRSHKRRTFQNQSRSAPRQKAPKSADPAMQEQHLVAEKSGSPSYKRPSKDVMMPQSELPDLRNISHEHEPCVQLKVGKANGDTPLAPLSGSYIDVSATPNRLHTALCVTRTAVTRFQKDFFESVISRQENPRDLLDPDHVVFLARSNNLGFLVRSHVYEMFFKGFENESFETLLGVSRFLDPDLRQVKYFEYFESRSESYSREEKCADRDIDDPQFEEFCKEKASRLKKAFPYCVDKLHLAELGSPPLALSFRAAAKSVWLLHKLAFSFEPPASIFRVEKGADVDPTYMETVVTLEDDERFVPKVGFMVSPGLRLRKIVMKCEVYLSGAATVDSPVPTVLTLEAQSS